MSAQTAADLRAAADVLRRDGWTQGTLTSGVGCHCALGALYDRAVGDPGAASEALWRFLGKTSIADWNDAPERTADEVIAALEAAADAAEAVQHRMLPGSHEQRGGPECVCGEEWSRWHDMCARQHREAQAQPQSGDRP